MTENELTGKIIEGAMKVHTALGTGLLESVYEEVLHYELKKWASRSNVKNPFPSFMMA